MQTIHNAGELPAFPGGYGLATSRLQLQPPCAGDVDALWPHVTDAGLTTFLAWEPHRDKKETAALIEGLIAAQQTGRGFHWIVRKGKEVIGLVSLIDVRRTHRSFTWNRAELAYWIGSTHQGHGYATEASEVVIRFGFEALGLHKIIIDHAVDNASSGHVPQKLGFRFVGEEREAFCKHGKWHDLRHYEILASEFLAAHR